MKSPYGICADHADELQAKILDRISAENITKPIKQTLEQYCQEAIDRTTEYIQGEYALVIEDIAKDRAKRMVQELLKGNNEMAQFFALEARETQWGVDKGKPFVYDPDRIRASIVEAFKDQIASAEMIALQEDNKRLRESVKFYQEQRSRY